ncbi:hypothetical protein E6W39_12770 [Kitasatospora acidiphila]|uniref:DUF6286 domain-containing protein n=1 Tax=Kitasatospora acidiphila TaxID=2567942 RepID=A0A540W1V8_9ACTN|nr:DUF6286 domain-containing protein [Kitasatospora acidiphila]TQF02972.1 hypothetical protein E6W39_12770 [Kitasatospora acidiphila]
MPGEAGRPRSPRTRVSALVALAVLAGAGALLYDAVSEWTGHHTGSWRHWLAHQLSTRHLDSPWALAGAAVVAALGLWLLVLAVAPGERRWLPLRQAPGSAVDRLGVAALLERRVCAEPMVASARVRVGRRRARVTVHGSADLDRARVVLNEELDRIGLVRPPALTVRGRRARHRPHMH